MEDYIENNIELTEETIETYADFLENARYEDDAYATCHGRMVTLVNPDEHKRFRFHLRTVDGRYIDFAVTVEDAIRFLMTGEYEDTVTGECKVW